MMETTQRVRGTRMERENDGRQRKKSRGREDATKTGGASVRGDGLGSTAQNLNGCC